MSDCFTLHKSLNINTKPIQLNITPQRSLLFKSLVRANQQLIKQATTCLVCKIHRQTSTGLSSWAGGSLAGSWPVGSCRASLDHIPTSLRSWSSPPASMTNCVWLLVVVDCCWAKRSGAMIAFIRSAARQSCRTPPAPVAAFFISAMLARM